MTDLDFKDTTTPKNSCPTCGKELDTVTSIRGHVPGPDDRTVCMYCGCVMVFQEGLTVRRATDAEILEMEQQNPDYIRIRNAVMKVLAQRSMILPKKREVN
jgi:hypothetical protein